ncbi:hypothetical protein C9890_0321 [Perkinsus sp. BL_2016]|nr:hypothetical protein C9890_0321 [Perkinsus sp. BL_2016]
MHKFRALYSSKSLSALTEHPIEIEPGLDPGQYDLPSTLDSKGRSFLGKPSRKQWISKYHLQELLCAQSPGVGSYQPAPVTRSCSVSFPTAKKQTRLGFDSADKLGPVYDLPPAALSAHRSISFARSGRFVKDRLVQRSLSPLGPGQYDSRSTLNTTTGRSFGVGFSAYDKVLYPGLEKERLGRNSSGPSGSVDSIGQAGIVHAFARSTRMAAPRNEVPAPGTYEPQETIALAKLKACEMKYYCFKNSYCMINTDKYWTPDVALTDDDTATDCVYLSDSSDRKTSITTEAISFSATPWNSLSVSMRSRTWCFLLGSSAVTVVTAVLFKTTAAYFDYLIACSLGLWLGWKL